MSLPAFIALTAAPVPRPPQPTRPTFIVPEPAACAPSRRCRRPSRRSGAWRFGGSRAAKARWLRFGFGVRSRHWSPVDGFNYVPRGVPESRHGRIPMVPCGSALGQHFFNRPRLGRGRKTKRGHGKSEEGKREEGKALEGRTGQDALGSPLKSAPLGEKAEDKEGTRKEGKREEGKALEGRTGQDALGFPLKSAPLGEKAEDKEGTRKEGKREEGKAVGGSGACRLPSCRFCLLIRSPPDVAIVPQAARRGGVLFGGNAIDFGV